MFLKSSPLFLAGLHSDSSPFIKESMFKCFNCSVPGMEDVAHCANSYECPTYITEQEKMKKTIHYYQKN